MHDEYQARLDMVYAGLTDLGFVFPRPEGAFYLFVPMDPALAGRIIEHGVTIVPGEAFGVNEPNYARISYAASRDDLATALGRIKEVMREIIMVKELLQQLSNAHGTSGNEESIYALIKKEITPYVDEILEDPMGNLIAVKHGDDFKVMLAAHMDEIGLMVSYVDEKGFIRFVPIGGWYAPTLYNQRVLIHGRNGTIAGVVGGKPPHMMKDEERKRG